MAERTKVWGLSTRQDGIPKVLRDGKFCAWRAQPGSREGKFDKIPHAISPPYHRISTKDPSQWGSFGAAIQTLANGEGFSGLGRLVEQDGIISIDLDNCVDTETLGIEAPIIDDWAKGIVEALDTYTELSPSGKGLRLFGFGEMPGDDFLNGAEGVEAYAGGSARYVTVTGWHLEGSPSDLRKLNSAAFAAFYKRYAPTEKPKTTSLPIPELLPDNDLPKLSSLGFTARERRELQSGFESEDRSKEVARIAHQLYGSGLTDAQVLSLLWKCPAVRQVALDHRRQKDDKALVYLWEHHCSPARANALADQFPMLAAQEHAEGFSAKTLPDLDFATIPPRKWVLGERLLSSYITATFAPGGVSKSTFSMLTAVSIATGHELTGEKVHERGGVWIINNEDDDDELKRRLAGICILNGVPWDELQENLFMNSGYGDPCIFAMVNNKSVIQHPNVEKIIEIIKKHNIKLLIVDPFISTHDADENDNSAINRVVDAFKRIAAETGCAIELIHHTKKNGGDSEAHAGDVEAGRGASSLKDAARIAVTLAKLSQKHSEDLGIEWAEGRRLVRLDGGKANFSLPDEECAWYRLETVQLPNGDKVGVHQSFDMTEILAARDEVKSRERDEKASQDRIDVLDAMTADRMAGPEVRDRLMSVWGVGKSQAYERIQKAIAYDRNRAIRTSVSGGEYQVWLEQKGRSMEVCRESLSGLSDIVRPDNED